MKHFALFAFLLISTMGLQAQCDECKKKAGFEPDFCFTQSAISEGCARFALEATYFYYQEDKSKKGQEIPLPKADAGIEYLVALAKDKKLKLSALDMIFLSEAVANWKYQMIAMVAEEAAGKQYTQADIAAMEFEETPSGLGVNILQQGSGLMPAKGKNVTVHYRGYLSNGEIFDESYKRGEPFQFPLGQGRVIKGWDEGIQLLPIGTRAMLKIPAEIGYGGRAVGSIPANSTLYFDVVVIASE